MSENRTLIKVLTFRGHTIDSAPLSWYRVKLQHSVKGLKQCILTQSLLQWKIPSATTAPHTQVSCYPCEDSPSDMTKPCYSNSHLNNDKIIIKNILHVISQIIVYKYIGAVSISFLKPTWLPALLMWLSFQQSKQSYLIFWFNRHWTWLLLRLF